MTMSIAIHKHRYLWAKWTCEIPGIRFTIVAVLYAVWVVTSASTQLATTP